MLDFSKENLLIKGNNLISLHCLLASSPLRHRGGGQIKLIYIDPPYNTGNDTFTYNDKFKRSAWLLFMRDRLMVAKKLLRDDGVIFISIDHNEYAYLKVLCDDVFDGQNYVNTLIAKRGKKSLNSQFKKIKSLNNAFEYILVYKKSNFYYINPVEESTKKKKEGYWTSFYNSPDRPTMRYPVDDVFITSGQWKWSKERGQAAFSNYKRFMAGNRHFDVEVFREYCRNNPDLEFVRKNKNNKIEYWVKPSQYSIMDTNFLKYNIHETRRSIKTNFKTQKNIDTVQKLIQIATEKNDIVLDFFAGSGTTGHAVLMQNKEDGGSRRFILIEQLNEHIKVCQERLQRVIKSENIDDSFVSVELAKFNQTFVDEIDSARSLTDLTQIWKNMQTEAFLQYTVKCSQVESSLLDESLGIEFKKQLLREVLDANQLYISKSEMDDVKYGISQRNKILTTRFYNGPEDQPRKFVN